jgi:hypothetical protein
VAAATGDETAAILRGAGFWREGFFAGRATGTVGLTGLKFRSSPRTKPGILDRSSMMPDDEEAKLLLSKESGA